MRPLIVIGLLLALTGCGTDDETPTLTPDPTRSPTPTEAATPTPTVEATPSPTPSPSPSPEAREPGTYIALGDSLAVGVGATRPAEMGYVARLAQRLSEDDATPPVAQLRNLAVSGETSTSMIRTGQLVAALTAIVEAAPPVTLVTLDIGGNDLLRLLGTEVCAGDPMGDECLQLLALTLEDFEANYRQIVGEVLRALEEHAPDARLAVMTYFNPFSGTDAQYEDAGELALLGRDGEIDCDADAPQARGMNDVIVCVGEELGAITVDVQPRFAGLGLELTHIGAQDIHANDEGYEVIADAFVEALDG